MENPSNGYEINLLNGILKEEVFVHKLWGYAVPR